MKLKDFLILVYPDISKRNWALSWIIEPFFILNRHFDNDCKTTQVNALEKDIPDAVAYFVQHLREQNKLVDVKVMHDMFCNLQKTLGVRTSHLVIQLIKLASKECMEKHSIALISEHIEKRLIDPNANKELPNKISAIPFNTILNIHRFLMLSKELGYTELFGGHCDNTKLYETILFAVNGMHTLQCLPELHEGEAPPPFYPGLMYNPYKKNCYGEEVKRIEQSFAIRLPRGVKPAQKYFPFKRVNKLYRGDAKDVVHMATDGKKVLFVRESLYPPTTSIIASKIASAVSKKHFSSERLLSNGYGASRLLPFYRFSLASDEFAIWRKYRATAEKEHIRGNGIVDEVCSFVREGDRNVENYGVSSKEPALGEICKIDFDHCDLTSPLAEEEYLSAKCLMTASERRAFNTIGYLYERLETRLHLALFPKDFFDELAHKVLFVDVAFMLEVPSQLNLRTNFALQLFLKDSNTKKFLELNPFIIKILCNKIIMYAQSHFDVESFQKIRDGLKARAKHVIMQVEKQFGFIPPPIKSKPAPDFKRTTLVRKSIFAFAPVKQSGPARSKMSGFKIVPK